MRLQEFYRTSVVPKLAEALHIKNRMGLPKLQKVVISVGLNRNAKDDTLQDTVLETLSKITGQKAVLTKAKKSVASFKIREGQIVGAVVTLRGKRMYDFMDKLIHATLPRVRDFRGLSTSLVDAQGNCTVGFREHIAFPEVNPDEIDRIHGLGVTIHTTAVNKEQGVLFLRLLGFPFRKE